MAPGCSGSSRRAIFVEDSVEVALPLAAVRERLSENGFWGAPLAVETAPDGGPLLMRVGHGSASFAVRVRVATFRERDGMITFPLRWEAAKLKSLFPVLDGNLVVTSIEGEWCHLALRGSYRPPLGEIGRWVDWIVLHRVAQATVHSFLVQVAGQLEGLSTT